MWLCYILLREFMSSGIVSFVYNASMGQNVVLRCLRSRVATCNADVDPSLRRLHGKTRNLAAVLQLPDPAKRHIAQRLQAEGNRVPCFGGSSAQSLSRCKKCVQEQQKPKQAI